MENLKPCPFCGKNVATFVSAKEEEECKHFEDGVCPAYEPGECTVKKIVCDFTQGGCGASTGYASSEEKAINLWNRRVIMDEMISKQAVMDCFKKWKPYMATRLFDFEKELSSIQSAKPKTGYWIKKITRKEPTCEVWHFECSECGEWEYRADFEHGKFCSNCGAKMEGVAE